jgi:hypothetical protein
VIGQQLAHRVAQQRRMVAGERRHQEHTRIVAARFQRAAEMHQLAERLVELDDRIHRDALAVDDGAVDVPGRLLVALRDAQEKLARSGDAARHRRVAERAERVAEPAARRLGGNAPRPEHLVLRFEQFVQHCAIP